MSNHSHQISSQIACWIQARGSGHSLEVLNTHHVSMWPAAILDWGGNMHCHHNWLWVSQSVDSLGLTILCVQVTNRWCKLCMAIAFIAIGSGLLQALWSGRSCTTKLKQWDEQIHVLCPVPYHCGYISTSWRGLERIWWSNCSHKIRNWATEAFALRPCNSHSDLKICT